MTVSRADPALPLPTERPVSEPPRHGLLRARREDLRWLLVVEGTIALALVVILQLWRTSPRVPLVPASGDMNLVLMAVKHLFAEGWLNHSSRLGAPFGQVLYDYPASVGDLVHLLVIKGLGVIIRDPALVVNTFSLLGF